MKVLRIFTALSFLGFFVLSTTPSSGAETFRLHGRVVDGAGTGVEEAEIFVYDSPAIRRPADFISARTARNGEFTLNLPKARYWAVARVRKSDKFGPLLPGDRHSGEPTEIDPASAREVKIDFVVADIREVAQNRQKSRDDLSRLVGRILDREGRPVRNAYAAARGESETGEIPQYLSCWTDEGGRYAIVLPPGKYDVTASTEFPPLGGEKGITVEVQKKEVFSDIQLSVSGVPGKGPAAHGDEAEDD